MPSWGVAASALPCGDLPIILNTICVQSKDRQNMEIDVTSNVYKIVENFVCGHCGSQSGYEVVTAPCIWRHDDFWNGGFCDGSAFAVVRCRSCDLSTLMVFDVVNDDVDFRVYEPFHPELYEIENPEVVSVGYDGFDHTINPTRLELLGQYPCGIRLNKSIPPSIASILVEVGNCLSVKAYSAAAVVCRKAIEEMARDFGVEFKE